MLFILKSVILINKTIILTVITYLNYNIKSMASKLFKLI